MVDEFQCGFCMKTNRDVAHMAVGHAGVFICDGCIAGVAYSAARMMPVFREKLIEGLSELRDAPPPEEPLQ